jgi:peptidyl-prolyl cis-trans isomerase A (cyclophilin A)
MRSLFVVVIAVGLAGCSTPSTPVKEQSKREEPKKETAPGVFQVNLDTSKGPVVLEIHRDWAPIGADHFYTLVKTKFYDEARFFRIVRNFVVQFGINANPKSHRLWSTTELRDDPVKEKNRKGTLTFATAGPHTRTTQLFINLKDNLALDRQGFAPIGKVISGMNVVESFYDSYGDMPPRGQGPDPSIIEVQGNEYLQNRFPRLDYIRKASIQ